MESLIYTRFSPRPKDKLDNCASIEVQTEDCLNFCRRNALDVATVLEDRETSARTTPLSQRPQGSQVEFWIRRGVRSIVCQKLDRIFRDVVDGLQTIERWEKLGVTLRIANDGLSMELDKAMNWLTTVIHLAIAGLEPRLTSERTSRNMLYRQRDGQRQSFLIPYGWEEDPDSERNSDGMLLGIRPCAAEQAVISLAREFRSQGMGYRKIGRALDAAGKRNREGNVFGHKSVKSMIENDRFWLGIAQPTAA